MACSSNCVCFVAQYVDDEMATEPDACDDTAPLIASRDRHRRNRPATLDNPPGRQFRRCRSLDLRRLVAAAPPRRAAMASAIDDDDPSSRPPQPPPLSTGTLSRLKAALQTQRKARADRRHSTLLSSDAEPVDRLADCRRELASALRYFHGVLRTRKLEMLGGSASVVLDVVLKLLTELDQRARLQGRASADSTDFDRVYKAMGRVIAWADRLLLKYLHSVDQTFDVQDFEEAQLDLLETQLTSAIEAAVAGAAADASLLAPPVPPRSSKPTTLDARRRLSHPPSGDSGLGADAGTDSDTPSSHGESLFADTAAAIDDSAVVDLSAPLPSTSKESTLAAILEHLRFADDLTSPISSSTPLSGKGGGGGGDDEDDDDDMCETYEDEAVDGDRRRTKRRSRRRIALARTSSAREHSLDEADMAPELLAQLRAAPNGELKIVETETLRVQGGTRLLASQTTSVQSPPPPLPPRKARTPSVYDNDHPTPPASALGSPIGGPCTSVREQVRLEQALGASHSRERLVNGRPSATTSQHRFDAARLDAAQTSASSSGDGRLVVQTGDAVLTTHAYRSAQRSPNGAPPLPPKKLRRNVAEYMQIVNCESPSSSPSVVADRAPVDMRRSTLASYVLLRDNLRLHEEIYRRKALSFQMNAASRLHATTPSLYRNIEDLHFNDIADNRIRLPVKFAGGGVGVEPPRSLSYPNRLALPAPPSVLDEVDVSDFLVTRTGGGDSERVRGGPVDALVAYATQPGVDVLLYQQAFLATYRTFVAPDELLGKLIGRYHVFSAPLVDGGCDSQARRCAAGNTFAMIVRVADELCPTELSERLAATLNGFLCELIERGDLNLARLLRQRLLDRYAQLTAPRPTRSPTRKSDSTDVLLPLSRLPTILEYKASSIAEQLTIQDSNLFQKIDLSEMLFWAQEQCEERSANLAAFTEHFNKMSYWARTKVLEQPEAKDRERIFAKFIKVMKHLRRIGNFNSYLALLSALDSGPVRRLNWPRHIADAIRHHSDIMDSSQSFKTYRDALAQCRPPCLPYVGLILQDLTFIHVGNKNYLSADQCQGRGGLVNFGKRWQQFTILDSVRRLKAWRYDYRRDEQIVAAFAHFDYSLSEDAIWALSEKLKPRAASRVTR